MDFIARWSKKENMEQFLWKDKNETSQACKYRFNRKQQMLFFPKWFWINKYKQVSLFSVQTTLAVLKILLLETAC